MSKSLVRPKIKIIDTNATLDFEESGWVKAKIESGSITPTTHIERQFQTSINDLGFRDLYKSRNGVEIHRFGINAMALQGKLGDERAEAEARAISTAAISPVVSPTPKSSASSIASGSTAKSRTEKLSEQVKHLPTEIAAISNAIDFLLADDTRVAVLADIVERETKSEGRMISLSVKPEITTHTVVLYKNPSSTNKHSVAVVDPSNFEFSLHLSNTDLATQITHPKLSEILTFYDKDKRKIYNREEGSECGFAPDKFRDCVDIAVKLAFYLSYPDIFRSELPAGAGAGAGAGAANNLNYLTIKSINDILTAPEVLAIERGGKISDLWYELPYPIRVRQSSDPLISAKFLFIAGELDKKFKSIIQFNENIYNEKIDQSEEILKVAYDGSCISTLSDLDTKLTTEIIKAVQSSNKIVTSYGITRPHIESYYLDARYIYNTDFSYCEPYIAASYLGEVYEANDNI